jgi:hypothetical protein
VGHRDRAQRRSNSVYAAPRRTGVIIAKFRDGSDTFDLKMAARVRRVLGRPLSIGRLSDVHTTSSDVGVICAKRGYQS